MIKSNSVLKMFMFAVLFFLSCAELNTKNKIGMDIPSDMKVTKLAEILDNPNSYHNKKVLLEGTVAMVCPSFCDLTYQEGTKSIEIYPKDFKFFKIKKGQQVRIYAEIKAGKERVIISALGLEVKGK